MKRKKRKRKKIEKRKSFRRAEANAENIKANLHPLPPPPPPRLPPLAPPPPPPVRIQKAAVRVRVRAMGNKYKRRKKRNTIVQRKTTVILRRSTNLGRENLMKNLVAVIVTRRKPRKSLAFPDKRTLAKRAILIPTERPEAITIVQNRKDLQPELRGAAGAGAGTGGEREAKVAVVPGREKSKRGHLDVPAKNSIKEMTAEVVAQTDTEEGKGPETAQKTSVLTTEEEASSRENQETVSYLPIKITPLSY